MVLSRLRSLLEKSRLGYVRSVPLQERIHLATWQLFTERLALWRNNRYLRSFRDHEMLSDDLTLDWSV